jgi:hypothetical protein
VSVPPSFSGGQAVLLRLQNRCGLTNTPSVMKLSVSGTCGFKFAATPNPTSNEVVISDLDATAETSVQVVDQSGNVRKKLSKKANKLIIDVSDLPDGIYFMMMTQRGVTETQQIVIKH